MWMSFHFEDNSFMHLLIMFFLMPQAHTHRQTWNRHKRITTFHLIFCQARTGILKVGDTTLKSECLKSYGKVGVREQFKKMWAVEVALKRSNIVSF